MKFKILAGINILDLPNIYYDFKNKLLYDNLIKLNRKEKYIETKNFEIKIIKDGNRNELRKEVEKIKYDVIYGFNKIESEYLYSIGISKHSIAKEKKNKNLLDFVNYLNEGIFNESIKDEVK